jgi:hypothetical protein
VRWGELAGVVGGVMNVLTDLLTPFASQEVVFNSFTYHLIEVLFALALAGTLVTNSRSPCSAKGALRMHGSGGSLTAFVGYALSLSSGASAKQPSRVSQTQQPPLEGSFMGQSRLSVQSWR